MDKLKDFVEQHRECFDNEPLPRGHLGRFLQKLPDRQGKRIVLYRWTVVAVAASLALLLLLKPSLWPPAEQPTGIGQTEQEMTELQQYYHMQIYTVVTRIKDLYRQGQKPGSKELLGEAGNIIAYNLCFEQTLLPQLPLSDNTLFVATQHYNSSLESLSFLLSQMEQLPDNNY